MASIILALSGGLDSTTLLAYFISKQRHNIYVALFKYGSKHNKKELEAAHKIIDYYKNDIEYVYEIDMSFLDNIINSNLMKNGGELPYGTYDIDNIKQTTIPFRNGIIASILCSIADNNRMLFVALGTHQGRSTTYPDCTYMFNQNMSNALYHGTHTGVTLITPFESFNKSDIVRLGIQLKVPYELTWSCYNGLEKHCGKCTTCNDRLQAFKDNNLEDPVEYL